MPILTTPSPLIRLTEASYDDGIASFDATDRAVDVASVVFDQSGNMPNSAGLSMLMVVWGQFIDHDLDLTRDASGEIIMVPGLVGPFQRSVFASGTGTSPDNPRAPVNEIAPEIDASMIYGSTAERTMLLRSLEGGQLRMSGDDSINHLLPIAEEGDVMAGAEASPTPIFLSGDVRANENIALTALHTLFSREHNYWANRLAALHPDWSDDELFAAARQIVEYEIQSITYNAWLPKLLQGADTGTAILDADTRLATLQDDEAGQVSVEFSTAAFRFGHTMVSSNLGLIEETGAPSAISPVLTQDAVFNSSFILDGYLDHILRGQAMEAAQEVDAKVIDDLNFFLRAPSGLTGFSLPALNILRGQDHGVAPYLQVRASLLGDVDLDAIDPSDFSVITSNPDVQTELASVYDNVFEVDLWVGGLAEDKPSGAQFGPVFAYIIAEQFHRTQQADETFLQLPEELDADLRSELQITTLRDILLRNTQIDVLQNDPFETALRVRGTVTANQLTGDDGDNLLFGLEGNDFLEGVGGDDFLTGGIGNDTLDGGSGFDRAVYSGNQNNYWIRIQDDNIVVMDRLSGRDGNDTVVNIEALSFADGDWKVGDFNSVFALSAEDFRSLTELYIACFDRAPDSEGLLFWATAYGSGMEMQTIASYFFDQDEMRALYQDISDPMAFTQDVYRNVLGREGDPDGVAFWVDVLESGAVQPAEFVLAILEGVRAPIPEGADEAFIQQKAADLSYLDTKADLGIYFAAIKGMSDVEDANAAMDIFDGSYDGMVETKHFIDDCYLSALDPEDGEFLLSLVGVVENPFSFQHIDDFF